MPLAMVSSPASKRFCHDVATAVDTAAIVCSTLYLAASAGSASVAHSLYERSQTAFASAELTTDLEGDETGRVVERISWSLTFNRR